MSYRHLLTNSYQQNTQTPKFEEYCKATDETALDGDNFEEKRKKKAKVKNTKFMGVDSNMDGCMLSSLSVKNRPSEPQVRTTVRILGLPTFALTPNPR